MNDLRRAFEATIDDVNKAERTIVARIGTDAVDRYRSVIDPRGIDLTAYRKNAVALWEHGNDPNRGALPIGRNHWTKRSGGSLIAKTQFAKDEFSRALFDLYRDGTLSAWSVRVLPDESKSSAPTRSEIAARPELRSCEIMYRAGELLEYSAVAVPGNAEALTLLEERGIWVPEEYRGTVKVGGKIAVSGQSAPDDDEEPDDNEDEVEDGEDIAEGCGKPMKPRKRALPLLEGVPFGVLLRDLNQRLETYRREQLDLLAATRDLLRGRV